ncbi:MAG TPA: alpha/beta fold hydrolase [Pseudolabrys sp.]|nr:alpha/beta fold hydrolase [Pseudolabrys sp.]
MNTQQTSPDGPTPEQRIAEIEARGKKHFPEFAPGRRLCWHRFGDGPPLVLLHGGHGSWLHFIRNIDALAARHSLWIADMAGYGESDDMDGKPDIRDVGQAVLRSLTTLIGADTAFGIVGFSFGGLVTAQLANLSARVRRIALIGTAGHGGVRRQPQPMVQWRNLPPAEETAALKNNLASLMLTPTTVDDPLAMEVHRRSCYRTRFRSRPISRQALLPPLLATLTIPVLLIWGSEDVTIEPEVMGPKLTQGHPEQRFTILPHTGHWAQFENHAAVNALLTEWFAEL